MLDAFILQKRLSSFRTCERCSTVATRNNFFEQICTERFSVLRQNPQRVSTCSKSPGKLVAIMGVRRGENGHSPLWKLGPRTKNFRKPEDSNFIQITWFNSCNDSLFSGITLILHKSQVHWSGVMQWWACSSHMSSHLPTEAGCKICE